MTKSSASVLLMLTVLAAAQEHPAADPAPLQLTAQQDHKLMMEALGIKVPNASPTSGR